MIRHTACTSRVVLVVPRIGPLENKSFTAGQKITITRKTDNAVIVVRILNVTRDSLTWDEITTRSPASNLTYRIKNSSLSVRPDDSRKDQQSVPKTKVCNVPGRHLFHGGKRKTGSTTRLFSPGGSRCGAGTFYLPSAKLCDVCRS